MLESTKGVLLSIGRKMLVRFLLELPTVESMILSSVELRNNEIHTDRRLILKMLKDFESAFREYTSRPRRLPNNENNKHQSLPQLSFNDSLTGAQKLHDAHVWTNEHIFVAIAASNEDPKRWPVTGVQNQLIKLFANTHLQIQMRVILEFQSFWPAKVKLC